MEIKNCPTCGTKCHVSEILDWLPSSIGDHAPMTKCYEPLELAELRADNARLSAALRRVNETLTAIIGDVHGIVGQLIDLRDRR